MNICQCPNLSIAVVLDHIRTKSALRDDRFLELMMGMCLIQPKDAKRSESRKNNECADGSELRNLHLLYLADG